MPKVNTITVELQRPGPPHNQLLSPLTPYLAMCSSRAANTVYLDFEQKDFLQQTQGLDYSQSQSFQEVQLGLIGSTMGRLLASIRSLSTVIAEAAEPSRDGSALINLRLISDAAELSMLPFEAATAAPGFPGEGQPLLLQSDAPICLTRESRKPEYRELEYYGKEQKILFAYAEFPNGRVPARAHLLGLRRAIDPWCDSVDAHKRLAFARSRITVLPNATLEAIREACSVEKYHYVHILSHGLPSQKNLSREQEFGLALHDTIDGSKRDFVNGERLAGALCGYDRLNQTWWCPKVVTLAACDSGHQGALILPGGSVAHALHLAGVPLVVASQFPLTVPGSALLAEVLYAGLLWGEDPFVLLHELRRRLYLERRDGVDWASLVTYSNWPASQENSRLTFQYNQAVRALVATDYRLRAVLGTSPHTPQGRQRSGGWLRKDLERIREFRTRMQQITPMLSERVTSFLHDIDAESSQLAEHNIDLASVRLQVQALIRQSDLECMLGLATWRALLKEAYRAIYELYGRSHASKRAWGYRELLLLIKLSVVLTRKAPKPEWCNEASQALAEAMERASKGPGPLLASPPELWLHAARAELLVLQAHTNSPSKELDDEVQKMCALVEVSDLDDVDQVAHSYGRMVDWWAKDLPPAVTAAAKRVVQALKQAAQRKWPPTPAPRLAPTTTGDRDRAPEPTPPSALRGQPPHYGASLKRDLDEGRTQILRFIGPDERELEFNPASVVPLCWLCRITAHFSDGTTQTGTAWLAGPRLVLTAAHVVTQLSGTILPETLSVWFAHNGNIVNGDKITLPGSAIRVPDQAISGSPCDYAAVLFPKEHSRQQLGNFGFADISPETLSASTLSLAGYSESIPAKYAAIPANLGLPSIQHLKPLSCNGEYILHAFDTDYGQSGSPIWVNDSAYPMTVAGIHVESESGSQRAVRIGQGILQFIRACGNEVRTDG